jgi:hypothetical protein
MLIEQNNFFFDESEGVLGVNYDTGSASDPDTLTAEENYWNTSNGPSGQYGESGSDGALVGQYVEYSPWLCDEAVSSTTTTDGECPDDEDDEDEKAGEKVKICHMPPGNPDNSHTITVGANAVQAHLAHGDMKGACDEAEDRDEESEDNDESEDIGVNKERPDNPGRSPGRGRGR